MVYDDVVGVSVCACRDFRLIAFTDLGTCISHSEEKVLHDDVMGIEGYSSADDRDSGTRCCLTGNRDIRILDFDLLLLEIDDSTDFEDDDSRTLGFKGFSERSLSLGIEIGNLDDSSTGSSYGLGAPSVELHRRLVNFMNRLCENERRNDKQSKCYGDNLFHCAPPAFNSEARKH